MQVRSPAKVNLFLLVTGRRDDGYHLIYTLFQKIALYDTLDLELDGSGEISLECPEWLDSGPGNLAYRAAELFYETTGIEPGVRIVLKKEIPAGGGLGGGSSNAASVLSALNQLYDHPLVPHKLHELAASLGADCPFFLLEAGAAIGSGTGTELRVVETPKRWLVLVLPDFGVSTRWAYENFKLTTRHWDTIFDARAHFDALLWSNDLEQPVLERYPRIGQIKERLLELGASASMMSGSGSTVFGVFPSMQAAREAAEEIVQTDAGCKALAVETL